MSRCVAISYEYMESSPQAFFLLSEESLKDNKLISAVLCPFYVIQHHLLPFGSCYFTSSVTLVETLVIWDKSHKRAHTVKGYSY